MNVGGDPAGRRLLMKPLRDLLCKMVLYLSDADFKEHQLATILDIKLYFQISITSLPLSFVIATSQMHMQEWKILLHTQDRSTGLLKENPPLNV